MKVFSYILALSLGWVSGVGFVPALTPALAQTARPSPPVMEDPRDDPNDYDDGTGEDTDIPPVYTPPPRPVATPVPVSQQSAGKVSIACLGDDGSVKNADASKVCKAILPKCSKLKESVIAKAKDMLSQKIWCYYNGKDCDLNKSSPTNLVGPDMAYPVCSVVGHKLQTNGTPYDLELNTQAIGRRGSCGKIPKVEASRKGRKFVLHYTGDEGSKWISYMLGAYPWEIRAAAYDVLTPIDATLSNVNEQMTHSRMMNADLVHLGNRLQEFYGKLSDASKASCNQPDSDLVARCLSGGVSVSDPAQRLCTMVKASLAAYEGAFPNMLVSEIMSRVQKQHDELFARVLTYEEQTMNKLRSACSDTSGFARSRKKKLSMTASCFFGGEYCTTDDGAVRPAPAAGVCGSMDRKIVLANGNPVGGMLISGQQITVNKGFAGVIERIIRNRVCNQSKISDVSKCDQIGIPSKPEGASTASAYGGGSTSGASGAGGGVSGGGAYGGGSSGSGTGNGSSGGITRDLTPMEEVQ